MPDLSWNKAVWGSSYHWADGGEEWSVTWGGSEAQWFGAIYPRLHRFLPTRRILEIAPGFGRWTRFLVSACQEYVGVELSEKCTEACQKRFSDAKHARFITNDGQSLQAIEDQTIDLVFSFDSLVHAEFPVLASYIPQLVQKLSPTGVVFIHHSNLLMYNNTIANMHGRATTVSADAVADLVYRAGGTVLIQEIVNWGGEHLIDCLTLFARHDAYPSVKPVRHKNPLFMGEASLIKNFQSPYCRLSELLGNTTGAAA
jgi:SAM-dependent methyltransferase